MLAGSIYWTCTAVVLHFGVYSDKIAATASLPLIIVHLFGIQALWIACIIGYLTCFASLNVYAQSFARLIWTQMQYQPDHYRLNSLPAPSLARVKRYSGLLLREFLSSTP
ncbi:transporter [Salmonella enterica subsp. enterica]|uniref:Transporter n=1 Tax=Salmonella enterica I TaxID=59201 RepID=A0A379WHL0_SALET|nr:transporter [Salmonella enterica subsp. enterica]